MAGNMPNEHYESPFKEDLAAKLCAYLEQHVERKLSVERICQAFNISRSRAFSAFKERTGCSLMHHFRTLKIEKAKRLIREERYNMTEIAEMLSYTGVHNFSRHFKLAVGLSPSEYARTARAKNSICASDFDRIRRADE